jgi:hypothetical protein
VPLGPIRPESVCLQKSLEVQGGTISKCQYINIHIVGIVDTRIPRTLSVFLLPFTRSPGDTNLFSKKTVLMIVFEITLDTVTGEGVRVGRPFGARRFSPVRGLARVTLKLNTRHTRDTGVNRDPKL